MATINPYLNFSGNCEEAFEFYRSVLGGEFGDVNRFSEAPGDEPTEADGEKIMHISLPLGDGQTLMGADRPASMGPVTRGDTVHVTITPDSSAEAKRIFEGLSDGGQVTMAFERAFWGADFGMCIDRYGIHWIVNYDPVQSG